jgi:hypothetical protein
MRVRNLLPEDIPALKAMYVTQGFGYEFPDLTGPLMEVVQVVVDEKDKILAAVAAERLVQLYFLCGGEDHPALKMALVRALHDSMAMALRDKGYHSAEAFLPPPVEKSFGRRLVNSFGWLRNWQSFTREF